MNNEQKSKQPSDNFMRNYTEEEIQEAEELSKEIQQELESLPKAEDTK